MPEPRHAATRPAASRHTARRGRYGSRRRRRTTGVKAVAPLLGVGLAAFVVSGGDPLPRADLAAGAEAVPPEVDLGARVAALSRPARAQSRQAAPGAIQRPGSSPAPTPEATPTLTPTPTPTPTATGFPPVPGCDATVPDEDTVSNGGLGEEHLCPVGGGHLLRPDAAAAYLALSEAYQEARGSAPCLTDSYRSLATQLDLAARKPGLAARPGTSEHGWGVAVDLGCGVEVATSAAHHWMLEHADTYGWVNPAWAQPGGSRPEPWHWEFVPDLVD
ncbi:MAG TPA: M15 family metallopeptidase [Jiangellales bacterium]|nr:M15 family metallopeptidase [Jiangellales bacterium]